MCGPHPLVVWPAIDLAVPPHLECAAELEHDVAVLREKCYQLEVEVATMTTDLERRKADLARASDMMEGGCGADAFATCTVLHFHRPHMACPAFA